MFACLTRRGSPLKSAGSASAAGAGPASAGTAGIGPVSRESSHGGSDTWGPLDAIGVIGVGGTDCPGQLGIGGWSGNELE
jgi:hypothetical protein